MYLFCLVTVRTLNSNVVLLKSNLEFTIRHDVATLTAMIE